MTRNGHETCMICGTQSFKISSTTCFRDRDFSFWDQFPQSSLDEQRTEKAVCMVRERRSGKKKKRRNQSRNEKPGKRPEKGGKRKGNGKLFGR